METSVNQRLGKLVTELGFSSIRQFGHALGYVNPEKLHRTIREEDTKPSYDVINDILTVFSKVSAEWLILGIGPMFKPVDNYSRVGDRIARILSEYEWTIESLAKKLGQPVAGLQELIDNPTNYMSRDLFTSILQEMPELSPRWLQTGEGKMTRASEFQANKFVFDVNDSGTVEISINVRKNSP